MQVFKNISLIDYNTFRVDVSAENLVLIEHENDFKNIIDDGYLSKQQKFFLGAGSNLLLTKPINGVTIKNIQKEIKIIEDNKDNIIIEADSGLEWHSFVEFCVDNEYYGLENLALIPGLLGAAPVQNIGAYGVEQNKFFNSLKCIDITNGFETEFYNADCKFDYRYSIFKQKNYKNFFITKVRYKLSKIFNPELSYKELNIHFRGQSNISARDLFESIIEIRKNKLPDYETFPNAGSFFKNPIVNQQKFEEILELDPTIVFYKMENNNYKISAANLIEKAGLKGYRKNNVGISTKHSLIIINFGNSSGKEINEFSEFVISRVAYKFKIELEPEVIII